MLQLHRRLLALRRSGPALAIGTWRSLEGPPGTIVYERADAGRRIVVALGLDGAAHRVRLPAEVTGTILLDTRLRRAGEPVEGAVELAPDDPNIHYQLGQAYQRLGRAEQAAQEFEAFRQLKDKKRGGRL